MKKSWILLDEDFFGTYYREEMPQLFWCGGDTYAIVFEQFALIKKFDSLQEAKNYFNNLIKSA